MIEIQPQRLERVLSVLAQTTLGHYNYRLSELESSPDDPFLELEAATNILLDELEQTRQRSAEQQQELLQRSEQIRLQQEELLRALSTPIIVVAPGVLALPIIGTVETARAQSMIEATLQRVVHERASYVILDLTAAGELAAATVASLLRLVQSVRLLGARCILTGISPAMARTLVALHFDSSQLVTLPQLADALALVFNKTSEP